MPSVTITIPAAMIPRVRDAMRASFPQHAALNDAAAFQEITAEYWRQIVRGYESAKAAEGTRAAAVTAEAQAKIDTATIV